MFLTENEKHDDTPITTSYDILTSEAGILEIVMEGEMFFHNLNFSMIKLEHAAILQENTVLLEKGLKDYWESFVKFLKEQWAKVKQWFAQIFAKLTAYFDGVQKFLNKYQQIITQSTFEPFQIEAYGPDKYLLGGKLLSTFDGKIDAMFAESQKATKDTASTAFSVDVYKKEVLGWFGSKNANDGIASVIKTAAMGADKPALIKIDPAEAKKAVAALNTVKQEPAGLKNLQKSSDKQYAETIKAAESIMKSSQGEDIKNEYKNKVLAGKNVISVSNQVFAGLIAGCNAQISDCMKILKAVVGKIGKGKKSESTNVLEQFGFTN